eukprot:5182802-Amphidinium_carterae.1
MDIEIMMWEHEEYTPLNDQSATEKLKTFATVVHTRDQLSVMRSLRPLRTMIRHNIYGGLCSQTHN